MKYLGRVLLVASAAFFIATAAFGQSAGNVTNHAFAIGKGASSTSYTSLLCTSAQLAVGQSAADPICRTVTGDVTITAAGVTAIGASKVTNSQLNTMAANTTKCNATAGTANPTDCTGSTMRTNLGLVIGTNVQAWDTDLDCLAALSSTGVVSRTGGGTCSAGSLALSGLATGTQDTVIGYFGSTTASAVAMNNCTGALTYSTTTHTFGCNASAGTGTVTSVATSGLATGGPITTTGTVTVTAATQSDQQTGTSTTTAVTPARMKDHDGVAKVVLMFTGSASNGAQTINFNYNVNAATRTGVGVYSISLINAFASTSYACVGSNNGLTTDGGVEFITQTASSIVAVFKTFGTNAVFDPVNGAYIVCYGRQ